MRRIRNIACVVLLLSLMLCLSACNFSKEELNNLTADNLLYVSIESNDVEDSEQNVIIYIDTEDGVICAGKRNEFHDEDDTAPAEITLTKEQCQELKERIVEYTYTVKEGEKDYWPQSDEYPEMLVLFRYEIWYGDSEDYEEYRETGALCYPEGWDDFVESLLGY